MTDTLYKLTEFFARGHRGEPRYTVLLTGTAITASGSLDVVIRDLSLSGALIQGRVLPGLGKLVILRKGPLEVSGRIAWREGNRAGVRFEHALAADQLYALVDRNRVRPVQDVVAVAA